MLVGAGTFAGVVFYGVVSFLLGQLSIGWPYLFRVALLSGLYNAILTPLVLPAAAARRRGLALTTGGPMVSAVSGS